VLIETTACQNWRVFETQDSFITMQNLVVFVLLCARM